MKKILILLALATMASNLVGCCCCRGWRDWFYQGAYCGPAAAPLATVTAPPAAVCPPQYAAPTAYPQYSTPVAAPMMTYAADPGCSCGSPYTGQTVYGSGYMVADPACGYMGDESGVILQSPDSTTVYPGPATE